MKILNYAKIIIIRGLRDYKIMAIMCLMPILLMYILGTAFSGVMGGNENIEIGKIKLDYSTNSDSNGLYIGFQELIHNLDFTEIEYNKVYDIDKSVQEIKDGKLHCAVEILEDEVKLYKSINESIENTVIEVLLNSYISKYNIFMKIVDINPMFLMDKENNNSYDQVSYVTVEGLARKPMPTSMEYYGILMTILFCMYGFMTPLLDKIECNEKGLIRRINTTVIKKSSQYLGEILGYYIINIIRFVIVFACTIILFNVSWGSVYPILMLMCMHFMLVSLGVLLGDVIKTNGAANSIAQILIIIPGFFGGAYLSLSQMGSIGDLGKYISAIWWANTGIINHIFSGDNVNLIYGSVGFLLIGLIFFVIGLLRTKVRESV